MNLRLQTLYDWFENGNTVIIAGRNGAFDRVRMGERAVATLNMLSVRRTHRYNRQFLSIIHEGLNAITSLHLMIFQLLFLQVLIPIPRENYLKMYFTLTKNPFPRRYLDEDFFSKHYFEDVATRYKGIYINHPTPHQFLSHYDSNRYLNKHLYRGHLVGSEGLERNLEYAPFFLTFWEGRPMIGYVWGERR